MMPAVACWLITSQAPTASTADCRSMRSTFEVEANPPATSLVCCWLAMNFRLASRQRAPSRRFMPIATSASALRRLVSARLLRETPSPITCLLEFARVNLSQHRERAQNDGARQRGNADQRVEREADDEIERNPGQIEEGDRPHPGQEGPQVVEVAQRLQAVSAIARLQRQADQRVVDAVADGLVEAGADPHQNAAADQIEHAERCVKRGRDGDQGDQGRHAVARQHPVIDLQHEDRAGEHQDVAHAAEHGGRNERTAAGGQRRRQFGLDFGFCRRRRKQLHATHQVNAVLLECPNASGKALSFPLLYRGARATDR